MEDISNPYNPQIDKLLKIILNTDVPFLSDMQYSADSLVQSNVLGTNITANLAISKAHRKKALGITHAYKAEGSDVEEYPVPTVTHADFVKHITTLLMQVMIGLHLNREDQEIISALDLQREDLESDQQELDTIFTEIINPFIDDNVVELFSSYYTRFKKNLVFALLKNSSSYQYEVVKGRKTMSRTFVTPETEDRISQILNADNEELNRMLNQYLVVSNGVKEESLYNKMEIIKHQVQLVADKVRSLKQ